jgi:catechol 2,3-dioxygenase-like lactoylglutathione lyase family enzyme
MKRLHINMAVRNIEESVRFYATLFAAHPTVIKTDYAKWMLDDPRVNFAITARGPAVGLDHLGIQVEDESELAEVHGRLKAADRPVLDQGETTCCYATSVKSWISDPQGIAWETFLTKSESTTYGDDSAIVTGQADGEKPGACCVPGLAPSMTDAAVTAKPSSSCC